MRDELRHTLTLALGTGTSSLLRIAYVVYAARVLGPAVYADLYAALSVIFMVGTGLAPIAGTVSRFASLYLADDDRGSLAGLRRFAGVQVRRVALGLLLLAPLVFLALRSQLSSPSWLPPVLVAVILPLVLLVDFPRGLLRGAERYAQFSLNLVAEAIVRLSACVVLLAWTESAGSALLAYLIASLIALPLGALQTRSISGDDAGDEVAADARLLRRFGFSFFLVAFIGAALQNVDVLVARYAFGDLDAGLYSAASSLAKVVALIYLPFGVLLLPSLTARFARDRRPKRTLAAIMAAFAIAALGTVGVLHLAGEWFLGILFGGEFVAAQPLIAPLGVAMTLALLSIMLGQAFTAMDRFGFLPFYLAALLLELVILFWTRDGTGSLARGLLISQLLTFALTLGCFVVTVRR